MPDIVLSLDGEEKTVSSDELKLPEGYAILKQDDVLSRDQHNELVKAAIDRRFKGWVKREEAAKDDDVRRAVLAEQPPAPDLETAKKQWEEREKLPLQQAMDQLTARLRDAELHQAAAKYFADPFVATTGPNKRSWAQNEFGPELVFDKDLGYSVAVDSDGQPLTSSKPGKGRPFMDADELFSLRAKEERFKPFLREDPKNEGGSGHKGSGKPPSSTPRRGEMSSVDKSRYIRENGKAAYFALPE